MNNTVSRALVLALFILAPAAHAQTYRCSSGGSTRISDRPCADSNRTQLGMYGPARSAAPESYSAALPAAPKAQEHLKYLPSGCASIVEAIRTAPARGVRGDVVRALHDEYNQKCSLEEQEARNLLRQEKADKQQVKVAERDGVMRERQQSRVLADQCASMKEVVALKRKRESTLNPMEVGALRDLESAYNARCLTR